MTNTTNLLSSLSELNLNSEQETTIQKLFSSILKENELLKKDLSKSIQLNFHYIKALSTISSDVQYLAVAGSNKGAEILIEIAKEALNSTIHQKEETIMQKQYAIKSIYGDFLQNDLTFSPNKDEILLFDTEQSAKDSMTMYGCVNCRVIALKK